MGVKGGPDPDETFHPYAVFHFDASNTIGNVSTTSFTNFVKTGSYTDWTIPSANAYISGTGASKALITISYNGNYNSLRASGTFNQKTSYSWSGIFLGSSVTTSEENKIVRPNDTTNFSINSNGTFSYQGSGIYHTSSALGLTSASWTHLLFTRSNTSCNLYVNNQVSYSFTLSSNYTSTDSDFRHNSYPGGTVTCGYLVYWHDYALSASEIQREYDKLKRRFSLP